MKIATFGCSYACPISAVGFEQGFNVKGRAWMKILAEDFDHDVTNFGVSASSVYYSYSKFKENYTNFDKIIFLGTYPDRKYCPGFYTGHIVVNHAVPEIAERDPVLSENRVLIENYFRFFHNIAENEDMKELMVSDIKRLCGNDVLYIDTPTTLGPVTIMEELASVLGTPVFPDRRWCHMSNANNYIFASQVNAWLNGVPFKFDIRRFKKPSREELLSYYEST